MRLSNVGRSVSTQTRSIAASGKARVEAATATDAADERPQFILQRDLPDRQPDRATARGTYLNLLV